jgi:signal transduction histidine kinase
MRPPLPGQESERPHGTYWLSPLMNDQYWSYVTAATYWLLILFWALILRYYAREYRALRRLSPLLGVLLAVIFIDGFRTLVESVYFGTWYTARTGLLPRHLHSVLAEPQFVVLPKLVNVAAAGVILVVMVRSWLPAIEVEIRRQREVERLYEELREAQAAKESLTRMLVHDMRTPLTNLLTGIRTKQILPDPEVQKELLSAASRGGERLLHMVNELLDVQRMQGGEMPLQRAAVALEQLVRDACDEVAELADERRVRLLSQVQPVNIQVDADLIRRVLVNLIANAIRYSPEGAAIRVGGTAEGTAVRVTVADEGPGIAAEHRERIFQPFYQVQAHTVGRAGHTGLGLAFCRLAVEAHGGTIGVDSEPGRGSTFWFRLPIKPVGEENDGVRMPAADPGGR